MSKSSFTLPAYWKYEINDYSYRGILWSMTISGPYLTLYTSDHWNQWLQIVLGAGQLLQSLPKWTWTSQVHVARVSAPSAPLSPTSSCRSCFGTICLAISASHLYHSLALLKLQHISPLLLNRGIPESFLLLDSGKPFVEHVEGSL